MVDSHCILYLIVKVSFQLSINTSGTVNLSSKTSSFSAFITVGFHSPAIDDSTEVLQKNGFAILKTACFCDIININTVR